MATRVDRWLSKFNTLHETEKDADEYSAIEPVLWQFLLEEEYPVGRKLLTMMMEKGTFGIGITSEKII